MKAVNPWKEFQSHDWHEGKSQKILAAIINMIISILDLE